MHRVQGRIQRLFVSTIIGALIAPFVVTLAPTPAAAFSDSFATATVIPAGPFTESGDNSGATVEAFEPQGSCVINAATDSVWWKISPTTDIIVSVDTEGSGFDTVLVAWRNLGAGITALTEQGCDDDGGTGQTSALSFAADAGKNYYIQLQSFSGTNGAFQLNVTTAPANDDLANVVNLSTNDNKTGSNVGASVEANEPTASCSYDGDPSGNTAWWRLTFANSTAVQIDTFGSTFDTTMAVYRGTNMGDLVEVACSEDAGGLQSSLVLAAIPSSETYFIQVDGFGGQTGAITLNSQVIACQATIFVDDTANGANTGQTWANAFVNLQDALSTARGCASSGVPVTGIRVARGTYRPTSFGADRATSFDLVAFVAVVGGFPDGGAVSPDPINNPTILSGDLTGDDNNGGSNAENSLQVVTSLVPSTSLSGVIVEGGNANAGFPANTGGGGVFSNLLSSLTLSDVIIRNNSSAHLGAGIYHGGSSLTVRDSLITSNSGSNGGAGIFAFGDNNKVINTTVSGNTGASAVEASGSSGSLLLSNGQIVNNTTLNAVRIGEDTTLTALNNLIADNGEIGILTIGRVDLINSTISGHSVRGLEIQTFGLDDPVVEVTNSILWGNPQSIATSGPSSTTFTNSLIQGSGGSINWNASIGTDGGSNIDSDPFFVDPSNGNYRLGPGSPATDHGTNGIIPTDVNDVDNDGNIFEPTPDLDFTDRVKNSIVDMGAYERTTTACQTIVFVDADHGGPADGTSWALAFPDLQDAIAAAVVCSPTTTDIWVADGTYTPAATDRTASFELPNEVTITGGFIGTEADLADRIPSTPAAILSGDLLGDDAGIVNTGENSFNVAHIDSSVVSRLVDLTVRDGNANGNGASDSGGGIQVNTGANLIASGVTITSNQAANFAGGINAGGFLTIFDSTISDNSANHGAAVTQYGGQLLLQNSSLTANTTSFSGGAIWSEPGASVTISTSTLADNDAGTQGGAIYNNGTMSILNTEVSNNTAERGGGAIYNGNGPSVHLEISNSLFHHNSNTDTFAGGGAIFNTNSLVVSNSTFSLNTAPQTTGGAILSDGGVSDRADITNSVFWDNSAATSDNLHNSGAGVTSNSDVQGSGGSGGGWNPNLGIDGGGNIDADPLFVSAATSNFRLAMASPATDAGDSAFAAIDVFDLDADSSFTDVAPDLDLLSRIQGSSVDMGAYETTTGPLALFTPLPSSCLVYDSAGASGGLAGAFDGGELRTITAVGAIPGTQGTGQSQCVPSGATAVTFSISVIGPLGGGNLRLSESGTVPSGGVVNFTSNGLNNANTVTVPVDNAGKVDIFANGGAGGLGQPLSNVRLVAIGYYKTGSGLRYNPLTPCAVADSRSNQNPAGAFVGPFSPGAAYPDVDVVGSFSAGQGGNNTDCGIPAGADAFVGNLVAVNAAGAAGHLAAGAGGSNPDEAVTPFAPIGMNNAATLIAPLNGGQTVAIDIEGAATASTHVRLVSLGYFDQTGSDYVPVNACAAFDTRLNQGAQGPLEGLRDGGSTTTYQIAGPIPLEQGGLNNGSCAIPPGATGVLINLVAVNSAKAGNLQVFATGTSPSGGVLNFNALTPAMNNSNAVPVPLSADGELDVFVNTGASDLSGATHIRGVILGYFTTD